MEGRGTETGRHGGYRRGDESFTDVLIVSVIEIMN